MIRLRRRLPLDFSLCAMTVTVYHREGLTRQVLQGVHYEFTDSREARSGECVFGRSFLLVVPWEADIRPGDKICLGEGPEGLSWQALNPQAVAGLGVAGTVKPRYFQGEFSHLEVRG